jgi:hypothetical protein
LTQSRSSLEKITNSVSEITLRDRSASFADEIQSTIRGVLPGAIDVQSTAAPARDDRFIVRPINKSGEPARIPLYVAGDELAALSVQIYLGMDRVDAYLKTLRMDLAVHSTLDRTPLARLEFRSDMTSDPIAHWQVHAERGSLSHLLARAHAIRPKIVKKPHDMSSLHFPVGGERFRPCLEDFLHFLVHECGVDAVEGWENAIAEGRERWRRRQLRTLARDAQDEVAAVLVAEGWSVERPSDEPGENSKVFTTW